MTFLAAVLILVVLSFAAQAQRIPFNPAPPPTPRYPPSAPLKDEGSRIAEERQEIAFREYQQCLKRHPKETDLYLAASRVARTRNDQAKIEYELAISPAMRAHWPDGYEQILASVFEEYRKAGGTAQNAEAVVPDDPCMAPLGRAQ